MERKIFEIKGKLGLVKEIVFRSIGLGKKDSSVSSPAPVFTAASHEPANSLTNHSLEAELKKAQALMYQRMFDCPK